MKKYLFNIICMIMHSITRLAITHSLKMYIFRKSPSLKKLTVFS